LELTIKTGGPLGIPETTFSYADANYLLLTEIIEQITQKPFYSAMRELLYYK
jgi:D-alanyl-D-alanine carboxypeptidase